MATYYQKGFLEMSSVLQQNRDAFRTLHAIYKLPNRYSSLPASATVQALEMLGLFSEANPVGIIDLPLVLGLKSTHKKIKKKLKPRIKYPGFNGIANTNPQLEKIVSNVQETILLLIGQLELLDMVLTANNEGHSQLNDVLLAVNGVKNMIDHSIHVHKFRDGRKPTVELSHNNPVRFVPAPYEDTQPLAKQPHNTPHDHDRKDFNRIPTPSSLKESSPRTKKSSPRTLPHHPVANALNEEIIEKSRSKSFELSQNERCPPSPTDTKPPTRLSPLLLPRNVEHKKLSPGPAVKPKPAKGSKIPIIPKNMAKGGATKIPVKEEHMAKTNRHSKIPTKVPQQSLAQQDQLQSPFSKPVDISPRSERPSTDSSYVHMNPLAIITHKADDNHDGRGSVHGYVNVGPSRHSSSNVLPPVLPHEMTTDPDQDSLQSSEYIVDDEYETFT